MKLLASGAPGSVIDLSALGGGAHVGKLKAKKMLHLSRSTPQLRTTANKLNDAAPDHSESVEKHPNPDIEKLRKLARKLIGLFPGDKERLDNLLSGSCGRDFGLALQPIQPNGVVSPAPRLPVVNDLDLEDDSTLDPDFIDVRGPSPKPVQSPIKRVNSNKGKGKQRDKAPLVTKAKDDSLPERLVHVFIDQYVVPFSQSPSTQLSFS